MGGKRQVQFGGCKPFRRDPLAPSSSPAGKLILLSEGDSVYKRAPNKGSGRFDYYVRTSETERKGKDRKTLWHEVDTREGLRVSCRWLRLLTCRASRFSNSFLSPFEYTIRRLPFDCTSHPRDCFSGSLCAHQISSNKADSAFPLFQIRRLTSKRNFARLYKRCFPSFI